VIYYKQDAMNTCSPQLYAAWRMQAGQSLILEEPNRNPLPAERLLQAVWRHQRLHRDQLHTVDGQPLQVLHPGFQNHEAGPDFRNAVLQFFGEPPCAGDVEVDLQPSFWRGHRHDQNPAFQQVLLQVVWETPANPPAGRRTLALKPYLDAPLEQLQQWLGTDTAAGWPPEMIGRCCVYLRRLEEPWLVELLRQAAQVRLQAKASQFEARARKAGWEAALWEGLFRVLGYKRNPWPMQCLGEILPRLRQLAREDGLNVVDWQARLLGAAGLLPVETPRHNTNAADYWRTIWARWWRERDALWDCLLPRKVWCLNGLRPANHPQRRLALMAHWLVIPDFPSRLEVWLNNGKPDNQLAPTLQAILQAGPDEFWSRHWTLQSKPNGQSLPLLGEARVTDLAINAVLPWLWARATAGRNESAQQLTEQRYYAWPKGEDNAILKMARQRLLGGGVRRLRRAAEQQGLLQIVHDFCDRSNSLCAECPFPPLLRQLGL
jgi:hypothetical protein